MWLQISLAARWWSYLLNNEYIWRDCLYIADYTRSLISRYPTLTNATLYGNNSPLMCAIDGGWQYLKEIRENDEPFDVNRTHLNIARVLIAEDTTDVNRRNTDGQTALDIAQHFSTMRQLLQREDIDVHTKFVIGTTVLSGVISFDICYAEM